MQTLSEKAPELFSVCLSALNGLKLQSPSMLPYVPQRPYKRSVAVQKKQSVRK